VLSCKAETTADPKAAEWTYFNFGGDMNPRPKSGWRCRSCGDAYLMILQGEGDELLASMRAVVAGFPETEGRVMTAANKPTRRRASTGREGR
jgi:hypothetical protein